MIRRWWILIVLGGFLLTWPALRVTGADITPAVVPPETADAIALTVLRDWRALPTFRTQIYRQFSSHDRLTGAPVPFRFMENGNRDANNFVCAAEGAQPAIWTLLPPVFDLPRCPEPYVHGFVVARVEGSGRLIRLWMTARSWRKSGPGQERLRIYVDDRIAPVIDVALADVARGTAGEIFAPPFGAGTENHLAWYYPVVFAQKLIVTVDQLSPAELFYHQTNVALDPTPGPRRAAGVRLPERDEALAVLRAVDYGPVTGVSTLLPATVYTLPPGSPVVVADLAGPATIHRVQARVASVDIPRLDEVEVSVRWDDGPPAIRHSLGLLLAGGTGGPVDPSLALARRVEGNEGVFELRLPMPFAERALWTLTQRSAEPLTIRLMLDGERSLPPVPWGYLQTQVHTTASPARLPFHPVAQVAGQGRYVGTCARLQGHQWSPGILFASGLNFLEGDERIWIDGERAVQGTGTEDYFNAAFYFEAGEFGTPFAQAWDIAENSAVFPNRGRVSACRWHVLTDAIDFQSGLRFDLEIGPGDPALLDHYQTVAFFYAQRPSAPPPPAQRMNIVLIMADDMGYGDWGPYDHDRDPATPLVTDTPALDRMAAEGVQLTDFYVSASICTPVRSALLTGRYQLRTKMTRTLYPNDVGGLDPSEVTLAEVLREAGYATALVGKWHLGDRPRYLPTRQGFERFFGAPYSNNMTPFVLMRNEEVVDPDPDQATLTQRYTEEARRFISDAVAQGRPFFLYMPHTFPHVPLFVSQQFAGQSPHGLYGDVIRELDWSVGQILDLIQELGLDDQTLVLFLSDNGPWLDPPVIPREMEPFRFVGGSAGPLRDGKQTVYEGGVRVPFIARWPGHIPAGRVVHQPAMVIDLFPTLARLAGVEMPTDRTLDGADISGLLLGEDGGFRRDFFFYDGVDLRAMRFQQWKLHFDANLVPTALYDLQTDLGETTPIDDPELTARLLQRAVDFHCGDPDLAVVCAGTVGVRQRVRALGGEGMAVSRLALLVPWLAFMGVVSMLGWWFLAWLKGRVG